MHLQLLLSRLLVSCQPSSNTVCICTDTLYKRAAFKQLAVRKCAHFKSLSCNVNFMVITCLAIADALPLPVTHSNAFLALYAEQERYGSMHSQGKACPCVWNLIVALCVDASAATVTELTELVTGQQTMQRVCDAAQGTFAHSADNV